MSNYPQIYVVEKYQSFLKQLSGVGKPPRVDPAYIKKLGFKSSYDTNFLSAIKYIGLVEPKRQGAPTELWSELRTNMGAALATGLKSGYSDVFEFYPDAHLRDEEALANFFRGNSDGDADSVARMVNAFVAVRDLATFDGVVAVEPDPSSEEAAGQERQDGRQESVTLPRQASGKNTVNLNIQLQLPSDASGEVYDKFFEAMKKHGLI